ncbi:zinc dependent phospholipase C family protein [Candidatus Woesearchaeota archaeon]|nr:zinc dependent phospholipase C family protein [Candidatus Woesearchaeota archaeon]
MKKLIILLLVILLFINGWSWPTHQKIAEILVKDLDLNLNMELVKEGSIAPDKYFKDFKYHSYPNSVNKSYYWLNKTIYYYNINDFSNASYSFGVLTHYVSDTFDAPHTVTKEDYGLHAMYEKQMSYYVPKAKCIKYDFNLEEELKKSQLNKNNWHKWLKTKDEKIPQKEVEQSLNLLFPLSLYIFDKDCKNDKISLPFNGPEISLKKILSIYLIMVLIIITLYSILRNNR